VTCVQHVPAGTTAPIIGGGFGVNVGFTADSRYLATSGDSAVSGWDPVDHLQLFHASLIARGALSPTGKQWVTAAVGGISVYPCELCGGLNHLFALAQRDTTRRLTPSERATYLKQG
jgi:hypothetical protein